MDRPGSENTLLGVGLIVASVFLLSLADALVKQVSSDLSLWQLHVARGLVALPLLFALLLRRGGGIRPKSAGWVLLRSLLLVAMWMAYYAALPVMSLAVAAVALYTTPLFIALFSALLIGEPVGARRWLGILIGFLGVLVILRPDLEGFSPLTLLPVAAAVFYALAMVITRGKCTRERPLVLSLALNLCLFAVGLAGTALLALWPAAQPELHPFLLGPWRPMDADAWLLVAFLALVLVAVSTGVAKAYQCAPAAIVGTFDYAYLVFAVLWSFLLFAEAPGAATLTGVALITLAGGLVLGRGRPAASRLRSG